MHLVYTTSHAVFLVFQWQVQTPPCPGPARMQISATSWKIDPNFLFLTCPMQIFFHSRPPAAASPHSHLGHCCLLSPPPAAQASETSHTPFFLFSLSLSLSLLSSIFSVKGCCVRDPLFALAAGKLFPLWRQHNPSRIQNGAPRSASSFIPSLPRILIPSLLPSLMLHMLTPDIHKSKIEAQQALKPNATQQPPTAGWVSLLADSYTGVYRCAEMRNMGLAGYNTRWAKLVLPQRAFQKLQCISVSLERLGSVFWGAPCKKRQRTRFWGLEMMQMIQRPESIDTVLTHALPLLQSLAAPPPRLSHC